MPRDTIKEKEYFDEYIEDETNRIIRFQNKIKDGTIAEDRIPTIKAEIHQTKLRIVIARFSRGDKLEEIIGAFDEVWNQWNDVFDPLFYSKILQMVSLAVLFNIDPINIQTKVAYYFTAGNYDWLIKYISIADKTAGKEIDNALYLKKTYQTLQEMVLEDQVNSKEFKKYLAKWYQRHSGAGWYNLHKSDELLYYGYWSFEAGAVAKIFGIDDEELKENKYYPYDLVHF